MNDPVPSGPPTRPEPGWYPDPDGPHPRQRYWNGTDWTNGLRLGDEDKPYSQRVPPGPDLPAPDPSSRRGAGIDGAAFRFIPLTDDDGVDVALEDQLAVVEQRLLREAPGLRSVGGIIELVGWIGVIGAVLVGLAISQQETTEFTATALGNIDVETRRTVGEGIGAGLVGAFSSSLLIAFGRLLRVLSDYLVARTARAE